MRSTPDAAQLHRDAICLDAAAPFIDPQHVQMHLADLQAGRVDAVFATVASIEDCRHAVAQLGGWLALARAHTLPLRLATSFAPVSKRSSRRRGQSSPPMRTLARCVTVRAT